MLLLQNLALAQVFIPITLVGIGDQRIIGEIVEYCDSGADALHNFLQTEAWKAQNFVCTSTSYSAEAIRGMIVFEALLESQRRLLAPALPSRLDCSFFWDSYAFAQKYVAQYRPEGIIHRCTVTKGLGAKLEGGLLPPGLNSSIIDLVQFSVEFNQVLGRLQQYWTMASPQEFPELLITGEIKVNGE